MAVYIISRNLWDNEHSWVLSLEPKTPAQARQSITWQVQGGANREDFVLCHYDPEADAFVSLDGEHFKPARGPYTEETWEKFRASLRA